MRPVRPLALAAALLWPASAGAQGTTTICHATGAPGSPYVELTVDATGLGGHMDHPDDIIPAPSTGCPGPGAPAPAEPVLTATPTPAGTAAPPVSTPSPTATPAPAPKPTVRLRPSPRRPPLRANLPAPPQAQTTGAGPPRNQPATLPRTGPETVVVALLGLGLLSCGLGLAAVTPRSRTFPGPRSWPRSRS